jgi:uncharacterized protein YggU (UPF0235/DUF167 family)
MMIEVKVHPGARIEKLLKHDNGSYEVWTRAPADKGRANEDVIRQMSRALEVPVKRILLRRGAASRMKYFEIL